MVLVLADGGGAVGRNGPTDRLAVAMLLGAAVLLLLGLKSWGKRSRGDRDLSEPPAWSRAISSFGPGKAALVGLVAAVNPKNLLLTVGGAVEIVAAGTSSPSQFAALAAFAAIGSLGALTPVAIRVARGERSDEKLRRLRLWLERHNNAIMAAVLLILGANLAGDALAALFS